VKHSQSLAEEISPTGEGVNRIVKKGEFKSFKPFHRCAPFKSLKTGRAVPVVPIVSVTCQRWCELWRTDWQNARSVGFVENRNNQIAGKASHGNAEKADIAFALRVSGHNDNKDSTGKMWLPDAETPFLGRKRGRYMARSARFFSRDTRSGVSCYSGALKSVS
jgi:hypothetical protein